MEEVRKAHERARLAAWIALEDDEYGGNVKHYVTPDGGWTTDPWEALYVPTSSVFLLEHIRDETPEEEQRINMFIEYVMIMVC